MKDYPWGWIRTNSSALPPFPGAVTGFCPVLEGRQRPPPVDRTFRNLTETCLVAAPTPPQVTSFVTAVSIHWAVVAHLPMPRFAPASRSSRPGLQGGTLCGSYSGGKAGSASNSGRTRQLTTYPEREGLPLTSTRKQGNDYARCPHVP